MIKFNFDDDMFDINWEAVFKCAKEYKHINPVEFNTGYREYMMESWGIDHNNNDYIRIIDSKKYTLFLLKWS